METRNGVVYDLRFSEYEHTFWPLTFRFSSMSHLKKFAERVQVKVDWLNDSFKRRFHLDVDVTLLAALQCYMQIETRGFMVRDIVSGRWYDCPEMLRLDGLKASVQGSTPQPGVTTTPCVELLG